MVSAIILAGGKGKRMGKDISKQFILVKDKPIIYYTIKKFSDCKLIDEIILVLPKDEIEYCKKEVLEKYSLKVDKIIAGGKERQDSVYNGLKALKNSDIVLIHDGVRPLITEKTIADNIAFGKTDATREEIIEAAKQSHAHSFIKRLPKGYDTVIGEDGGSLSQGQKQLLCIARVMLASPPMLILDEATSSIDTRTEIRIQKAFNKMMKGRTTFIVAHRLSTIKEADIILVMNNGKIIEQGNHQQLLEQKGFYYNLYNSQYQ